MQHYYYISTFILSIILVFGSTAHGSVPGFQNGQSYVISSVGSGKVFTAGLNSNFTRSAPVVAATWNEEANQRWLALEAPTVIQISPSARELQPSRYFLIPQKQQWDWKIVTQNGTLNITNTRDLPHLTEVLSLDSITGNLTTEVFQRGSSSQMWTVEHVGDKEENQIAIRNVGNNQCVKNFDYKAASLLQRIFSFIRRIRKHQKNDPNPLSTLDCNAKDVSQKWLAEI